MQAGKEEDILGDGIAQPRDEGILGEQSFDAALFSPGSFLHQGGEIFGVNSGSTGVGRMPLMYWRWSSAPFSYNSIAPTSASWRKVHRRP